MRIWEYKVKTVSVSTPFDGREINQLLGQLGGDGWEAFAAVPSGINRGSVTIFMKREIKEGGIKG